jgi:hypothetical protein
MEMVRSEQLLHVARDDARCFAYRQAIMGFGKVTRTGPATNYLAGLLTTSQRELHHEFRNQLKRDEEVPRYAVRNTDPVPAEKHLLKDEASPSTFQKLCGVLLSGCSTNPAVSDICAVLLISKSLGRYYIGRERSRNFVKELDKLLK